MIWEPAEAGSQPLITGRRTEMPKGRELLLNSTLLVASTIFCLVVAEAGLRFFPVMSGLHALPVSKDSPVFRFCLLLSSRAETIQ